MAKGSRFCSSCGQTIHAGKLDAKTGKLKCPRCPRTYLMNRKVGDFAVDECPSCSGMWIEAGAFDRIVNLQSKRQDQQFSGMDGRPVRAKIEDQGVVYLKCPLCRAHMHRRNFARASGVIIDECKKDGIWLDADELGKIAAFIASGGLAYERERRAIDAEQAKPSAYAPLPGLSEFPAIKSEETPLNTVLGVIRAIFGPI
jgi:Zn-finger nucleic acid-binding protein